jgi:hypothetical protein
LGKTRHERFPLFSRERIGEELRQEIEEHIELERYLNLERGLNEKEVVSRNAFLLASFDTLFPESRS